MLFLNNSNTCTVRAPSPVLPLRRTDTSKGIWKHIYFGSYLGSVQNMMTAAEPGQTAFTRLLGCQNHSHGP